MIGAMREPAIRIIRFAVVVTVLLLVSGCLFTQYRYEPPVDEAGQYCVLGCQVEQKRCSSAKEYRCTEGVRSKKQARKYVQCLDHADSKKDRRRCERQYVPSESRCDYVYVGWNCDGDYRQCYSACGGRVIKIVE